MQGFGVLSRAKRVLAMLAVAATLAACELISPPPPSEQDRRQALAREEEFQVNPEGAVLEDSLGQCKTGTEANRPIQVCDFCFVAVSANGFSTSGHPAVERFSGSQAFKRAISGEQPDVEPVQGGRGVWVPEGNARYLDSPSHVSDIPDSIATTAGFRSYHRILGNVVWQMTDETVPHLTQDSDLRRSIIDLVGSCRP